MRKIKMKTTMAGPDGNVIAGQIISKSDEEAKMLVDDNYAEYIDEAKEIEEAVIDYGKTEKAVLQRGKGRKK